MGRIEAAAIENWEQSMYLSLFGNGQERTVANGETNTERYNLRRPNITKAVLRSKRNGVPVVPQRSSGL